MRANLPTMRIGIDLGGTKIEVVALDRHGAAVVRRRVPSPSSSYTDIVDTIGRLVEGVEAETGERASVGVGAPGSPSPATGLMRNANSTVLNGKPFAADLEFRLARPVRLANDANCFALSEASDGAAADAASVFGAILGTGVGGGVVIRGELLEGRTGIAGEWGHNPLPWAEADERPGPACYCGKRGCIETFLSGPGLARDDRLRGGPERDARAIVAAASDGDGVAVRSLERYVDRAARAFASVVNLLDPDLIVLGGGLSAVSQLYDELPSCIARYAFSDTLTTRIVRPAHGDASGVRGAAWLWPAA